MAQKNSSSQGKSGKGCFKGCLVVLVIIVVCITGLEIFRRYAMRRYEENFLKTYTPSAELAEIAQKTSLTDKAKKIFYQADPEFIGSDIFATYCLGRNGAELALACARSSTPDNKKSSKPRIFLLRIEEPEFADSRFPSSAHEILHIAYRKLSTEERERIGNLIDQELARRQDDSHLRGIGDIIKTSGDDANEELRNEMHSIFGVEYRDISSELEEYYAQYFFDRKALVLLYENAGFEKRIRKIGEIARQTKIVDSQLTSMSTQLTAYQKSGDTDSYNSMVAEFNAKVYQYNAKVQEGKKLYSDIEVLYALINPSYQPPQEKTR